MYDSDKDLGEIKMIDKKASILLCEINKTPNKSFMYYSGETKISYSYVVRLSYKFISYGWVTLASKNGREHRVLPTEKAKKIYILILKLEELLR